MNYHLSNWERTHMGEIQQRRIYGQVARYEDVNILQDRVGDTERKQTVQHIQDMQTAGYITAEEALNRQNHAAEAETRHELRDLTSDLPGPVDHRGYIRRWNWDQPKYHLPVLAGGLALSILLPIITGLTLNVVNMLSTHAGEAIFWPVVAVGVMGFFLSIVLLVIKSS